MLNAQEQQAAFEGLPAKVAGIVDNEELRECCEKLAIPSDSTRSARFVRFAMLAASVALKVSGTSPLLQHGLPSDA